MNIERFKEIVSSFLASNDHMQIDKGTLMLQVGTDFIDASLSQHDGLIYVKEDGIESKAEDWIIRRLAMLDLLADRIISSILDVPGFVTPKGTFLDEIERAPGDKAVAVPDAVETVKSFLARRPGGTCSVLYLTSDAGEGKTTLINHLARTQAELFKKRESDWLLVPIGLGGRPFLRFDDVVVAAFMNQLRFQRLYFDAFVELVRMGVLVPALDGFEEIFVETSEGDAVSSLGTLINQMHGEGTLLIAARRAYFEFRRLQTQARLLDTLRDSDVGFGRVSLDRWSRSEFLRYCQLVGFDNARDFYAMVAAKISPSHPLLTRAILVRRLVELGKSRAHHSFVDDLKPDLNAFFSWLVNKILEREAHEKWIDKHGEPPKPLLTVQEHHELLSYVAEEMWISKTSILTSEMMDSLAEIFCEVKNLSPVTSRQVKERLKQHALIVSVGMTKKEFAFDHDDFREFFLGEQLAEHLLNGREADVRKIFRTDVLPSLGLDTAMEALLGRSPGVSAVIDLVLRVGLSESSSTFVRENAGSAIARLLEHTTRPIEVSNLLFPVDALKGRKVSKVTFHNCYFRPTSLERCWLNDCELDQCEFEHLGLVDDTLHVQGTVLSRDSRVHSLTVTRNDEVSDFYDPDHIHLVLGRHGLGFAGDLIAPITVLARPESDQDLRIAEKALQTFHRVTFVSDGTFRLRLGNNASKFFNDILPRLARAGILEPVKGAGTGRRFRLGVPLSLIASALGKSTGSFDTFLKEMSAQTRQSIS